MMITFPECFWFIAHLPALPESWSQSFLCKQIFYRFASWRRNMYFWSLWYWKKYENIHFHTRLSYGDHVAAAHGWLEIPHDFQQSLIVLLHPHKDHTKQGRRWNHVTWSIFDLWAAFCGCCQQDLARSPIREDSSHVAEPTQLLGSLYSEQKWLEVQGFTNFVAAHFIAKCHVCTLRKTPISAACTWNSILSAITRNSWPEVKIGERPIKNLQLCGVSKLPFRDQRAAKLTQNYVCLTNPCINLHTPPSVTRKYHKVGLLELLDLLQCIATYA